MSVDWLALLGWALLLVSLAGAAGALGWIAGRVFLRLAIGAHKR